MKKQSFTIRTKLILIFILIKVLPLLALAWFAWHQITELVEKMDGSFKTGSSGKRVLFSMEVIES